jgi:hypothetical protein
MSLDIRAIPALISEISLQSTSLPTQQDIMLADFSQRQAASLLVQLITRLQIAEQEARLTEAIEKSSSLFFAGNLIRAANRTGSDTAPASIFSTELMQRVGSILLHKLSVAATDSGLIDAGESRLGYIVYTIRNNADESTLSDLKALLQKFVAAESGNAVNLLKALAGRTQSGTGAVSVSDLKMDTYESICSLVDPDQMYQQLLVLYGGDLADAGWMDQLDYSGNDDDRRIADQFSFFHNRKQLNSSESGQPDVSETG